MSSATHTPTSPKALLKQMLGSVTDLQAFLQTHLSPQVQGAVAPRYLLNKPETQQRFAEAFAFAAGGTLSLLTAVEEGSSACARVLLTKKKHDLRFTQTLDPRKEVVVEASIWLELNDEGQIIQLHFIADMLTPGMVMGMEMAKAQA